MPTSFSATVDMVDAPSSEPLSRARTAPPCGGPQSKVSSGQTQDSYSGLCGANGKPYSYPAPVYVRNTFVVLVPGRDPSLEEFYEERRIHSCPASWGPTFENCKEEEEVPPASSSTTVCGSGSEGSGTTCTPPPEFSDNDDTGEPSPRAGASRAAVMPSSWPFPKTLSDYSSRSPLPPGPIVRNPAPQTANCEPAGYNTGYAAGYHAAFAAGAAAQQGIEAAQGYQAPQGYDVCYDNSYEGAYDTGYAGRYMNSYDGGYNANLDGHPTYSMAVGGYQASAYSDQSGYQCAYQPSDFTTDQMEFTTVLQQICGHAPTERQPQVLELSAAIQAGMQPPPPPGAPAPMTAADLPLPPPPLTDLTQDGLADMVPPTRGSMNHGNGRCKPCAFVYSKGCGNGFECPFCHLCEQGEKKKRRKDKLEAYRSMRSLREVLSFSGFSGSLGNQGNQRGSASA